MRVVTFIAVLSVFGMAHATVNIGNMVSRALPLHPVRPARCIAQVDPNGVGSINQCNLCGCCLPHRKGK